MVNLKPANNNNPQAPTIERRAFKAQKLILFVVVSIFVHALGFLLFALYQSPKLSTEKTDSKPIGFVVVPEEPEVKAPLEAKEVPPKETTEDRESTVNPPEEPIAPPPQPVTSPPPAEPASPPTNNPAPVLSNSDSTATPTPKPTTPEPKSPVVSNEPSQSKVPPESVTPQTTAALPRQPETQPENSASSLLGGDYKKTLANSGDAFFSPEALEHQAVLNPEQLDALKGIDLSQYAGEINRKISPKWNPSWNPSFRDNRTTVLTFDIQKNGQINELQVSQSSGSEDADREALEAVRKSAPFAPLPPEFPLETLKITSSFEIYFD